MNWKREHERFLTVAYHRTMKAAKRAFYGWRSCNRDDAIQECLAKMWDSWSRLLHRGKNPEPMTAGLIKFAILWVKYDRKIAGRSRVPDVYDFRSGFKQQQISEQGQANPADRSDPENTWISWNLSGGDNPSDLAAALETSGISLAQWYDC